MKMYDAYKVDTQQAQLQCLELHALRDKGIFYRWVFDKVGCFTLHQSIYFS